MPSCAVATCTNTYYNCKDKEILFHRFPEKNREALEQWILKCRRKDPINTKNARICSEHFLNTDYEEDLKSRLLGCPMKKILKASAIPSCNLPFSNSEQITPRSERQKKRKILQNAHERLRLLSPPKNL